MMVPAVRLATKFDADDLAWVLIAASPSDPNYDYRSPQRNDYPEDFAAHCRLKCREYLDANQVVVYESPLLADPEKKRIVAFSVWERFRHHARHGSVNGSSDVEGTSSPYRRATGRAPSLTVPAGPPSSPRTSPSLPARRDAHPPRMSAFRDACATAKTQFFDSRFARGHMFLKILMCHPDYRRRGCGRALTSWGVRYARRRGLTTTLFSSPMGYPLYRKLGFQEVDCFRVQVAGEDAFLDIPALVLPPLPRAVAPRRRAVVPAQVAATLDVLRPTIEVH